jgi:hypothetical protein
VPVSNAYSSDRERAFHMIVNSDVVSTGNWLAISVEPVLMRSSRISSRSARS